MALNRISFQVFKNGVAVPNCKFSITPPDGVNEIFKQISGNVSLDLLPTDVITLRQNGTVSAVLQNGAAGEIVASMNVVKVD